MTAQFQGVSVLTYFRGKQRAFLFRISMSHYGLQYIAHHPLISVTILMGDTSRQSFSGSPTFSRKEPTTILASDLSSDSFKLPRKTANLMAADVNQRSYRKRGNDSPDSYFTLFK